MRADLTDVEARALLTMVEGLTLPYIEPDAARRGIAKLREQAVASFCRSCEKPGVFTNRRGYKVCADHMDTP